MLLCLCKAYSSHIKIIVMNKKLLLKETSSLVSLLKSNQHIGSIRPDSLLIVIEGLHNSIALPVPKTNKGRSERYFQIHDGHIMLERVIKDIPFFNERQLQMSKLEEFEILHKIFQLLYNVAKYVPPKPPEWYFKGK